ncbi:MAG: glutamate 5-kinase [Candidatus Omnitrophota bacterium]
MVREDLKKAKRIVIKIGTSVLVGKGLEIDKSWMKDFIAEITGLIKKGYEVILVSSGAIAQGMHLSGLKKRPKSLPEQQACAAIGQCYLVNMYDSYLKKSGFHAGQILLTWEDIRDRRRYLNAENTIHTLISKKAVPIINENDTVSVDEIKFGDNDMLSSLVANLVGADLLIMLTDVDGFYSDGKKLCIDVVKEIDVNIEKIACGTDKECSLGGMRAKLEACKIAMFSGVNCVIANGRKKGIISKVLKGEKVGTLFIPKSTKMQARKRWIAYNAKTEGKITVDDGAKEALIKKNTSLLAIGVKNIEGKFLYGDVVSVLSSDGKEFAKGLSNYSSEDLSKIKGLNTRDAEKMITNNFYQEVIHRDNLVVI